MAKKDYERLVTTQEGLKITIEGLSEVFGGADLQLKALLSLMQFDFKFLEDGDMDISTKYFLTILDRLGEIMKRDDPNGSNDDGLVYARKYIGWAIENKTMSDPDVVKFMGRHIEESDEE